MRKNRSAAFFLRAPVFLLVTASILLATLSGCEDLLSVFGSTETTAPATEPAASETEAVETVPPTTAPIEEVRAVTSYTASDNEVVAAAHETIATVADATLENADLQIYYQMAVISYRDADNEVAPDFTKPLDEQICPLSEESETWQQYFLEQALNTWHCFQALYVMSGIYETPTEEAYKPDEEKHAENLQEEIYNLDVLYGYNTQYTVADDHQEYLDALPETLEQLAQEKGYESLSDLVREFAGIGTTADYFEEYAELCNRGYMLVTTFSYYIEPTEDEIEDYFETNQGTYADAGITEDSGYTVDIREILVDDESTANTLLKKCKGKSENNFAEVAFANSEDTGSSGSGGLYSSISKGQLSEQIDAWCFDEERKTGDTTVIQTDSGYHVLYFCGKTDIWYAEAEKDLKASLLSEQIQNVLDSYPMTVNYAAVRLSEPTGTDAYISVDELLFPDIAHERFPVAPLYFQQDYEGTMYGKYALRTYGCGVTTMAMLTTYMTDEEWTPPEMAALYGDYCSDEGTAHTMFTEVPTDRGFYVIEKTTSWDTALQALKDGYMVVTLQHDGYWTGGGHYLLLHNLIETEDGLKVQVRDSNLYNYKKLEGHLTGYFDLETISPNARLYWIYQKKVVRSDSCARCGEPTEDSVVPTAMFAEDYYCSKCITAMNRRNTYLQFCCGIG